MLSMACPRCRFVWQEDRKKGDSPIHHKAFICARCDAIGNIVEPPDPEAKGRLRPASMATQRKHIQNKEKHG